MSDSASTSSDSLNFPITLMGKTKEGPPPTASEQKTSDTRQSAQTGISHETLSKDHLRQSPNLIRWTPSPTTDRNRNWKARHVYPVEPSLSQAGRAGEPDIESVFSWPDQASGMHDQRIQTGDERPLARKDSGNTGARQRQNDHHTEREKKPRYERKGTVVP